MSANPYVHIELSLATGIVKTETNGVSVAQALELMVEGLHSLKQEVRQLNGQPAVDLLLPE